MPPQQANTAASPSGGGKPESPDFRSCMQSFAEGPLPILTVRSREGNRQGQENPSDITL
jgi:hypothetical protein